MKDDPIRPELVEQMNHLASAINSKLPAGYGFALLVFNWGVGFMNYISNANREDMIKCMKEFIERWESDNGEPKLKRATQVAVGDRVHTQDGVWEVTQLNSTTMISTDHCEPHRLLELKDRISMCVHPDAYVYVS